MSGDGRHSDYFFTGIADTAGRWVWRAERGGLAESDCDVTRLEQFSSVGPHCVFNELPVERFGVLHIAGNDPGFERFFHRVWG